MTAMQSILNFSWGIWWSVLCNFEINKADINCKFIFHSYNKLDIVIAQPLLFCRHDGGGGITGVVSEGAGWLPRGQDQRHVLQLERRPGLLCPHTQIQASPHRLPQPRYQGLERVGWEYFQTDVSVNVDFLCKQNLADKQTLIRVY